MQILSINKINYKTQSQKSFSPSFQAAPAQINTAGYLKPKTSIMIQDFLHGYNEIKEMLAKKTAIGLEKIAQSYPDVTLGENLIFHNCGEDKNSINIRVAESQKYKGMTYIARRQGNTESTRKIILNSFMLQGHDKLISNFKSNYSKSFPNEKIYIPSEIIERDNLEEELQKLLLDLEPMLLKFRKFLAKNSDSDLKLPDGKLDYTKTSAIKESFRICKKIEEKTTRISHKQMLKINSDYENYNGVTGLKSYMFKNLGEEILSINFSEYEDNNGYNLKRLYIYDKENNPLRTFLIVDNEKFVKNLNPKYPHNLPNNYVYANTKEIETDFLPEFQKYFELYINELKNYEKHINKAIDNLLKKDIAGEFNINSASLLSEALDWYNLSKIKLRKLPSNVANSIKSKIEQLDPTVGRTGLWLKNNEKNELIQFLPINNKQHENLIRISVTNLKSNDKKEYLIHNFKYIVKNYNPQYPAIIPKTLKYATEKEIEDAGIENHFRYIKNKCEELAKKADEAFDIREKLERDLKEKNKEVKNAKKQVKQKEKKEHQEFIQACKQQFADAMKNLDEGIENFNKALLEIQNKVNDFYATHKNIN